MAKNPFNKADQERIQQAVAAAESATSGEIVPYYVERSDDYSEAIWRGGLAFVVLGLAGVFGIFQISGEWSAPGVYQILGMIAVALVLGMGLAYIPFVRRLLAGDALINRRVYSRAMQAFIEEEVFQTRDRTGILIFMSMFEHRVLVMGDSGINARVKQDDWDHVVQKVIEGIKNKQPAEGLVDAIGLCGELLHRKGVAIKADDTNELPDSVRIGDS